MTQTPLRYMLFGALIVMLALQAGCGQTRQVEEQQDRKRKETTVAVRQEQAPDGKIIQLTTKTTVIESETTGRIEYEDIQITPPVVVGDFAGAVKEGIKAVADKAVPGGGYLVETICGALGLGATGAGVKAVGEVRRRRKLELQTEEAEEKNRKIAKAMNDYANDIENAETDEEVYKIKEKHVKRQKALGIHDDMERLRHG